MAIPGFVPLTSIPLSCESSDGPPDWALIELQGELERRDAPQPGQEFVFGQITRSALASLTFPLLLCFATPLEVCWCRSCSAMKREMATNTACIVLTGGCTGACRLLPIL